MFDSQCQRAIIAAVNIVRKSSPIESLGLGPGVHRLRIVVSGDTVAYEVEMTDIPSVPAPRKVTGFVGRWSGTARKMDIPDDEWMARINAKHLR